MLPKLAPAVGREMSSASRPEPGAGTGPAGTCGTGRFERWVRDRYGNADFTDACRAHDACYDTCGASKDACDSAFGGAARAACDRAYPSRWHVIQRRACREIANGYQSAVHRFGGDAFRAAQRAAGC